VINHILGGTAFFAELAEAGVAADRGEDPDFTAGDFNHTFSQGASRLVAAFNAPGAVDKIMKTQMGELPGLGLRLDSRQRRLYSRLGSGQGDRAADGSGAGTRRGDAGEGHADAARLHARPGGRGAIRPESRGGRIGAGSRPAGCLPGPAALKIYARRREALLVDRAACTYGHGVIAIAEILAPVLIGFPGVLVAVAIGVMVPGNMATT
jgi:hypothetical protein